MALAVAAMIAAPATAGLRWRELARGHADLAQLHSPVAFFASTRIAASTFSVGLPQQAIAVLDRLDFKQNAVVAVFAELGCQDHRVVVSSLIQRGRVLDVVLVKKPLASGTMECMAIYPTYRLLAVAKAQLGRPLPTSVKARLARA